MRDPKKKCIAKKCVDCNFYQSWNLINDMNQKKIENKCSLQVLFDEIPRIRGSIDGCQTGVNEARNQSLETKSVVAEFTDKTVKTLKGLAKLKLLEGKNEPSI